MNKNMINVRLRDWARPQAIVAGLAGCETDRPRACRPRIRGFNLVQVMVSMSIVGFAFVALYTGVTAGFSRVKYSRENQRATQILIEKMETIRLYNWEQINTHNFVPEEFSATYYPEGGATNAGVLYSGTVKVGDCKSGTNYEDDLKVVTIELEWKNGKVKRERTLKTYVGMWGLHNVADSN